VDDSADWRINNITNPVAECGLLLGNGRLAEENVVRPSDYDELELWHRNLYVCATGVRASVKTVDFRYNGTKITLSNLQWRASKARHTQTRNPNPFGQ